MGRIWKDIDLLAKYLEGYKSGGVRYTDRSPTVVVCSGGLDPIHPGHTRYIQSAARLGDCLVVVVNGDGFLLRKKGYVFMPIEERLEVVAALAGVNHVVAWDDGSQFVDGALVALRPSIFAKGGDRSRPEDIASSELAACERIGCTIAYGVGGTKKVQSSSRLCSRFTP